MNAQEIVSRDPEVMGGELVFSGTRVPVKALVDYLKAGHALEAFLDDFPTVDRKQAEAYLEISVEAVDDAGLRIEETTALTLEDLSFVRGEEE